MQQQDQTKWIRCERGSRSDEMCDKVFDWIVRKDQTVIVQIRLGVESTEIITDATSSRRDRYICAYSKKLYQIRSNGEYDHLLSGFR